MARERSGIPRHLAGEEAGGLVVGEPIAQFEVGRQRNLVHLVIDWETRRAALVDPQRDLGAPLEALGRAGVELERVLITHTHFDHVAGLPELIARHPRVPVVLHRADLHRVQDYLPGERAHLIEDGEVFRVGKLEVEALVTPGHSAGHCCYLVRVQPPYLLGGDCAFIRDCGRTDLDTGSDEDMFRSLQRLRALPPATVLLPGHHYQAEVASTLGDEVRTSAPFRCRSVDELRALP